MYLIGGVGAGPVHPLLQHQRADGAVAHAGNSLDWHYQPAARLLVVGDPRGRRVTLVKAGEPVEIEITSVLPAAPNAGQPILLQGVVRSATPALSTVRVSTGGDTLCDVPTQTSPDAGSVGFECEFAFAEPGVHRVSAQFVATPTHAAFGAGTVEIHIDPPPAQVFVDGFETPPDGG